MLVAYTSVGCPPFLVGLYWIEDDKTVTEHLLIGRVVERVRTFPDVVTALRERTTGTLPIHLTIVPDLVSAFVLLGQHPDRLRNLPTIDHRVPFVLARGD
jgi:hypothetical protein